MKKLWLIVISFIFMNAAEADVVIKMYSLEKGNNGKSIGIVRAQDSIYGLLLYPNLHDLPPGIHGFHIHDGPFCGVDGAVAGGHLDPRRTKQHRGPYDGSGHLGDLPVLIVDKQGHATLPILAPRLKLDTIKEHALMIHRGEDNYSDEPLKSGGGGHMIACGTIPYPH